MNKLSHLVWQGIDIDLKDRDAYPRKVTALIVGPTEWIGSSDIENEITALGGTCYKVQDTWLGWLTAGLYTLKAYQGNVEDWITANPDLPDTITDLVFFNGQRDWIGTSDEPTIRQTINDTLDALLPSFPNARVHTTWAGWGAMSETDFPTVYLDYVIQKDITLTRGLNWIPIESLLHACNDTNDPDGDFQGVQYLNLTTPACARLGEALAQYLVKGLLPVKSRLLKAELKGYLNTPNNAYFYSYTDVSQNVTHMYTNDTMHFEYATPHTFSGNSTPDQIAYGCEFLNCYVFGHQGLDGHEISSTVIVTLKTTGNDVVTMPASIYIYQGNVYLAFRSETNGVANTWTVSDLYIAPFEITFDTMVN